MSQCRNCDGRSAIRQKVHTDAGPVEVLTCMVCDRARCSNEQCNKSLPGNASKCASCGTFTGLHPSRG